MPEVKVRELKEEIQRLQEENAALKAEIEDLKGAVKDYSVVNGFLRRSYERKSMRRRRFW